MNHRFQFEVAASEIFDDNVAVLNPMNNKPTTLELVAAQ